MARVPLGEAVVPAGEAVDEHWCLTSGHKRSKLVTPAGEAVDEHAALDGVPEDGAPRARVAAYPMVTVAPLVELGRGDIQVSLGRKQSWQGNSRTFSFIHVRAFGCGLSNVSIKFRT